MRPAMILLFSWFTRSLLVHVSRHGVSSGRLRRTTGARPGSSCRRCPSGTGSWFRSISNIKGPGPRLTTLKRTIRYLQFVFNDSITNFCYKGEFLPVFKKVIGSRTKTSRFLFFSCLCFKFFFPTWFSFSGYDPCCAKGRNMLIFFV